MRWLLTRARLAYLAAVAVATALLAVQAAGLTIERNNASMNAPSKAEAAAYARFKSRFGNDEDLLLSLSSPRLLAPQGLRRIDRLTSRIEVLDGVRSVLSLTNARQLVHAEAGAEDMALAPRPWTVTETARALSRAVDRNPQWSGLLLSSDRRTAGILVEIEDRRGDDLYRGQIIEAIRHLMLEMASPQIEMHLTGISVEKYDVGRLIARDQQVIVPLALLVLTLVLALFFRRPSGVVLPLLVTAVSLVWTLGFYRLAGLALNPITALLPPVVMVLSIATAVHLYHGWLEAAVEVNEPLQCIVGVVKRLWRPCFFTALTTALGLSSLVLNDTPAVQRFGLFAALGVMISFAAGMTLLPVGLSFLDAPHPVGSRPLGEGRLLEATLRTTVRLSLEHPRAILLLVAITSLAAAACIPMIRNNTDLVRFLKPAAPLYQDTLFIDRHLTGPNSLEFMVSRRDRKPLTSLADLGRIQAFERAAAGHEEVSSTLSVLPLIKEIHRAESDTRTLALPADPDELAYCFDLMEAGGHWNLLGRFTLRDYTSMRISVRLHTIGTATAAPMAAAVLDQGRDIFGPDYILVATGSFYEVAKESNRLVRSQINSFGLALLLVMMAIGLLLRSWRLMLLSLVPNLPPVLWTAGLMGCLGIDLSTGTAMIASVVIGMAVDDTIHFLARFLREQPAPVGDAIARTTLGTGRALTASSVVLVLGFWTGCFGSFRPTIYFSLLTGTAMITALACDLLALPACLVLAYHRAGE